MHRLKDTAMPDNRSPAPAPSPGPPHPLLTPQPAVASSLPALCTVDLMTDDYAEIWVNGELPRVSGRPSPATIQGFNMPNRLVLAPSVKPGDSFQLAVFGINGPISVAPPKTVWFREAKVEFYR